ncbi:MAG: butyrate kinase [Erysipelotrichales bacterium]|nr:MAG: butyrate kinase [Erysipelotrichales bacterium]
MAKLFVLNLGSTSTKVGLFENDTLIHSVTLRHSAEDLRPFKSVMDQVDLRRTCIERWMDENGFYFKDLNLLVVRGPLVKPIEGGIYELTREIVDDAITENYGVHITNVGILLGYDWGQKYSLPVIFVDAPITDEFCDPARYSGLKGYDRRSVFHALNSKQIVRETALKLKKEVKELNIIVAHMGGGITVSAHAHGRVIDVNNALDGEGPFSPERSGGVPAMNVLKLAEDYDFNRRVVKKYLIGQGGMTSYLGHSNVSQALEDAKTDLETKKVLDAMAYQIAKQIGAMACVLRGSVDAVCFTGGIAHSETFVTMVRQYTDWIAPVHIYPGEDELRAMALGGLRYLNKEEKPKQYR